MSAVLDRRVGKATYDKQHRARDHQRRASSRQDHDRRWRAQHSALLAELAARAGGMRAGESLFLRVNQGYQNPNAIVPRPLDTRPLNVDEQAIYDAALAASA